MATMTAPNPSPLTPELIESVINGLPIQGRIMLRLILLQHFDVTDEEIQYMVADRPDPRCVAGSKPTHNILTQDAIRSIAEKRDQYLRHVRLKRERTRLQCDCLVKLMAIRTAMAERAADLLATKFGVTEEAIGELKAQARTALPKPAIRALDQRWDAHELTTEDYQRQRLSIDMQTHIRLADKYRKRLDLAERERQTADFSSLQDHEVCHIWGLPAGSLAARKVKYMTQFLQGLQAALQKSAPATGSQTAPLDLWKETFAVLATRPVQRSTSIYDGLESTETELIEKETSMAWGSLNEDVEAKFWLSLVQGASSNAVHSEITRSLFGLQRLAAILNDLDTSAPALDEALLSRATPKAFEQPAELPEPAPADAATNEMKEHVLKSMFGEQHPDLTGGGKW
jgi:mRNA-degrading endonuclease toxin of MazEF toxin-antitoxin module